MQSLARTLQRDSQIGLPLPDVWPSLAAADIRIRRSQVTMVAGQPNAGKSAIALVMAIRMGVPTMFFSADTDLATTRIRAAAALSGAPVRQVEAELGQPDAREYYEDVLGDVEHIRWCFDSAPSLDDIAVEIAAFHELWGIPPALVVIDNLMDIAIEDQTEWAAMRKAAKVLKYEARTTGSAFVVLHHCSEGEGDPSLPPARRAIQGKVSQLPALILTVANTGPDMRISCVKNRHGKADPSAATYVTLRSDLDRMDISERPAGAWTGGWQ